MGFARQGYWSGLPFSPPRDLSDPGIEPVSPVSPALQADSLPAEAYWPSPVLQLKVYRHVISVPPTDSHDLAPQWPERRLCDSQLVAGAYLAVIRAGVSKNAWRELCHPDD